MKGTLTNNWHEANLRYLLAAIGVVREALAGQTARLQNELDTQLETQLHAAASSPQQALATAAAALPAPSTLERLCATFNLSGFERDVLLLCAAMDLDSSFPALCATAQGDPKRAYPTFSLALEALPETEWDALIPSAPLRRWKLIEVGSGSALTLCPLRIDERVLHYLTGVQHLDERLMGNITPLTVGDRQIGSLIENLVPSHRQQAEQIAATWSQALRKSVLPIVQICGDEIASKQAIAVWACHLLEWNLHVISAHTIPTTTSELNELRLLWEREVALNPSVLLLDCDEIDGIDAARESAIARLIEGISSPLIVSSRDRRRQRQRPLITFDVRQPTTNEQRIIWQHALGDMADSLNGHVDTLVSQFNLSTTTIYAACAEAMGRWGIEEQGSRGDRQGQSSSISTSEASSLSTLLWDTCRAQARPRLDDLAQPIHSSASWDDLVLPERERQVLRDIAAHVRQRAKVYRDWGFAGKSGRGLGISALFAGSSGTGKTMAAEVLAVELRLDLYRIDLSSVVSKYIGETEKNLRRVFDAAEGGAAILLFDEADALFGKRSEVKDSHDRYANMEVSYLLQRMEAYQGLAILTTNLRNSLDTAFMRRLRFVVQFPFPDATQRAEIWNRVFPKQTPTEGLNMRRLAQLNVAGGNIRNIALNAAFQAADAGEPVGMKHVLYAARTEYTKLERTLTDSEIKGWV